MVVSIIDFIAYVDAFVLGWITLDLLANLLLAGGSSYTRIRFFGSTFLSRNEAIIIAYAQVILAMVASFYIVDWIFGLMNQAISNIIAVSMLTIGVFHLYILSGLPYNITLKRSIPSIVLFALAYIVYTSPQWSAYLMRLFGLA